MALLPLPSFADIILVFVLLVPGFISFMIYRKIALAEEKLSDFESTIWSLALSLVIYAIYGYSTNLQNIDSIRNNVLIPLNVATIFGLAIFIGGLLGVTTKFVFKRGISAGSCWEKCIKSATKEGDFVLVNTSDGKEFKGALILGGLGKAPKEIVLKNPKLIIRKDNGEILSEFEIGESMLFKENDISRLIFLHDIQ